MAEPSHDCSEILDAASFCRHVKFLRLALGKAAVPEPEIDIGPAFNAAAEAALGSIEGPSFSPYAANSDDLLFLLGALLRRFFVWFFRRAGSFIVPAPPNKFLA